MTEKNRFQTNTLTPDRRPVGSASMIQWATGVWRDLLPEHRTDQKWKDLVACCRALGHHLEDL